MEIHELNAIKTLLRRGSWQEAEKSIFNIIDNIVELLDNAPQVNNELILEFNGILTFIKQAIENRDVILLCDMLEYEVIPFYSNLRIMRDENDD